MADRLTRTERAAIELALCLMHDVLYAHHSHHEWFRASPVLALMDRWGVRCG